ncbi:hypothetical protein SERLA73DRAFT_136430 [Serpula lacrymans var. lacrymans S7.3]|uniref:Uncharacterized protein n=2 Tax=Serpula lacrymans var. lacrymans TaxID=341189 RepID=F8PXI7_SERL3|nr:uncharacterized protein SERLADRAFT_388932 [Serpula lacrymans var. lacrymans S7.9]EGN98600.1 hypothetical protein SERLA73DRAFT_136430 [Serpula lacrymans var. lacrymans S7.3]EGO24166.1 hypothetical protein SERLADRAFT_388932 [Serpula lacrymans var. lacrymans S7.9]
MQGSALLVDNSFQSQPESSATSLATNSPNLPLGGTKRRLGMGRVVTGYSNKKFKAPTS